MLTGGHEQADALAVAILHGHRHLLGSADCVPVADTIYKGSITSGVSLFTLLIFVLTGYAVISCAGNGCNSDCCIALSGGSEITAMIATWTAQRMA
jgi:hypothetical protein